MKEEYFLQHVSDNFHRFYQYTKRYCKKHGKTIRVVDREFLIDSGRCSGFCDGSEMVVAFKNAFFEEVYCHEFAHLQQCVEKHPLWDTTFNWSTISNKRSLLKNWQKLFDIIELERDCEARALRFSKRYNLFNNVSYAKRANIALYFYQYVFLEHRWCDSSKLFQDETIFRRMPQTLVRVRDLHRIDMNMMMLYQKILQNK